MKLKLITVVLPFLLASALLAEDKTEMLTVAQPVDIVSAVVTAKRAAASKGKEIEKYVVTSAFYFGDEALAKGSTRLKFWEDFAKEKGIKTPCWVIRFSQKKITADRVDDYIEMIGLTVFVSAINEAAVMQFKSEELPERDGF